ncbi:MAG: pyridoxal phosphate-dependent aminotransferase [Streptococcaceae bacterium]|jgi:cystathionine beta-lyase|nr:pyridoxal phosphate-dependent aminotransferase [Streptococcaceae bacterium]
MDFEKNVNRKSSNSVKWDTVADDVLPLWIADMDFQTVPEITRGLVDFAQKGIFGYTLESAGLYQSIIDWESRHHNLTLDKEDLLFIDGVVPAISVSIQAFTQVGDAVLINTPVYPPFARTVKLNGRRLIENELVIEDGKYVIDFDKLEQQFKDEQVKLYVFCSPHNPVGRVWTKEELFKIGELCRKYHVRLVSDEIHQDFALFGNTHYPFLAVSESFKEFAIILSSATKTFNIAGTKNSYVIIQNSELRRLFKRQQLANNQHEVSSFGQLATELAYQHGDAWLDALKLKIEENIKWTLAFIHKQIPRIKVSQPDGTYLLWLDFSDYGLNDKALQEKLLEQAKVYLNLGITFGATGTAHARLNVATSTKNIKEALKRIEAAFK